MQFQSNWISTCMFAFAALPLSLAQTRTQTPQPRGDVFSTRGDDRGKYVSKDGRWFDRCSYDRDHMAENPYTKQYGPPDYVPVDAEIMRQYARCAVDACAVNEQAVCWGKKPGPKGQQESRTFVINCRQYSAGKLICENLPSDCKATNNKTIICDTSAATTPTAPPDRPPATRTPSPKPSGYQLPADAIASGDPDAPDSAAPGFLGSFPGTKSKCGSFCYSYLWERGIYDVNFGPTLTPGSVGHSYPQPGDVAIVYQRLAGTTMYQPLHFAVHQGNGIFYQRNGVSSVEIVSSQFFNNFSNAIVRYVTPGTGK